MKLGKMLFISVLFVAFTAQAKNKVVYGIDNRLDLYETESALFLDLAKSTAAMIDGGRLNETDNEMMTITGSTLESRGICSTARFAQQITAASCSGFLVAPNLLVTAGHCVTSQSDCNSYKWVFGYGKDAEDKATYSVEKSNVYSCKRIVDQELDRRSKDDYALLELDRPVLDRDPLEFRSEGQVEEETNLVVIGHPSGLPTKVAAGAWVRRNVSDVYFSANLDTFGGNSGSAVFDSETGVVEGILVRGETDYVYDSRGCRVPKVCSETGCRGEDVTRITNISELIISNADYAGQ